MSERPALQASTVSNGLRRVKRRRFLAAGALSLLLPGLGQIYNTRLWRGFALIASSALLDLAVWAALLQPPAPLTMGLGLLSVLALVGLRLVVAVTAALDARRLGFTPLTRVNRWFAYVGIVFAYGAQSEAMQWALTSVWGDTKWKAYDLPSAAMTPTALRGDYFLAWRSYYLTHQPERGDLAVFKLPRDNKTDYIKRIVGLPGDHIQMKDGVLFINGEPMQRERLQDWEENVREGVVVRTRQFRETMPNGRAYGIIEFTDRGELDNTPVHVVPQGHYFVMGDNRDNSLDSRTPVERFGVGFVPQPNLRDRPAFVYWSADRSRIGVKLQYPAECGTLRSPAGAGRRLLDGSGHDDLDEDAGAEVVDADRGAGRQVRRLQPRLPRLVHVRLELHVGDEDQRRKQVVAVGAVGGEQPVDLREHLTRLSFHAEGQVLRDDAGDVQHALVLDHVMEDFGTSDSFDHVRLPDSAPRASAPDR
jgi:signal peptidase I